MLKHLRYFIPKKIIDIHAHYWDLCTYCNAHATQKGGRQQWATVHGPFADVLDLPVPYAVNHFLSLHSFERCYHFSEFD